MKKLDILDSSEIKSFSIQVSEEIHSKYLLTSLRTHIKNEINLLNDTTCFYYYFHPRALIYDLIVFDRRSNDTLAEVFLFRNLSTTQDHYVVYRYKDSFALFIDSKLATFKNGLQSVSDEDIKNYIKQRYGYEIQTIISLSGLDIETAKSQKINVTLHKVIERKSFFVFKYFVLFLSMGFLYSIYYIQEEKYKEGILQGTKSNQQNKLERKLLQKYKELDSQKNIDNLLKTFEALNTKNIKIIDLKHKDNEVWMQLVSLRKETLLEFLEDNKKNIKLLSIKTGLEDSYQMEVELDLRR